MGQVSVDGAHSVFHNHRHANAVTSQGEMQSGISTIHVRERERNTPQNFELIQRFTITEGKSQSENTPSFPKPEMSCHPLTVLFWM